MTMISACNSGKRIEEDSNPNVRPAPLATSSPVFIAFSELIAEGPKLRISERAQRLKGERVKLVGYMANLELPPVGAFYLTPIAVSCDEAGDGAAELPLNSVLVTSRNAAEKTVSQVDGIVEVVGEFDVGRQTDSLGRVFWFQLTLDETAPMDRSKVDRVASREIR
jgi:hypothetical protein